MPGSVTAVTLPVPAAVVDVLRVIFVFALFVPGSEGLCLGLTKMNHHRVSGVGEHLPIASCCGKSRSRW